MDEVTVSIITPSLNQGSFLEETILSVLDQKGDFKLEYLVIDGGSTDQTIDILKKYDNRLNWFSGPDQGQTDAVNKGFAKASGDILGWLNSDDLYEEGSLAKVVDSYKDHKFEWCFGNCRNIDEGGREIRKPVTTYKNFESRHYSRQRLLTKDFIPQPAVFIARQAFREIGPLNKLYHFAMDYDYWLRLASRYSPLYIDRYLARFRWHRASKSKGNFRKAAMEAYGIARKHAPPGSEFLIFRHFIHVLMLNVMYSFLP